MRRSQEKLCSGFEREIKRVEKEMRACIEKSEPMRRDARLLCSVYGVAFLTASVILAELGDLCRFERARQLSAYVGVSPRQIKSGSSLSKPTHMCKQGNRAVRKALYMSALTAIRDGGPMQSAHQGAVARGKTKMAEIGIVMRKLLVLMRAILISGERYDPLWKTQQFVTKNEAVA